MPIQIKPKELKVIKTAQSLLTQNNASAAKEVLLEYSRSNKLGQHSRYLLCLSQAILGEHDKALKIAVDLVKSFGSNNDYLKLLGNINHELQQYEQAISMFRRALKVNSRDFQTLANLANSLKENHQYDEAESYYEQSLSIQKNQPEALTNYGLLKQVNAKIDDAIELHKAALQLSPNHTGALYNLAYALLEKGEYEQSLQTYDKVIKASPYHIRALCDVAHILVKTQQPEKALDFLQQAIQINSNDEYVHLNLGIAHNLMKNKKLAESSFNEVIRINPDNQTATYYLAIMRGDSSISSSPDDYVQQLFDGYAETFDEQLMEKLQYKTPELISDLVKQYIVDAQKYKILDLGCGTGLAGIYLKDISDYMVGVDLSPKMLKKAQQRGIYDELVACGIDQYFESYNFAPNIVVSADVFVYIGDLSSVFSLISRSIQNDGLFVFSTEDSIDCKNYELRESGRFAHNEAYIMGLANEYNFCIIEKNKTVIRQESNKPINGQIYLLKKL